MTQSLALSDITRSPRFAEEFQSLQRLAGMLANSGYFQDVRDVAQAAVKVMAGREMGIPPVASMMGIHIIKGKVSVGAHIQAALVRQCGYDFRVMDHSDKRCVIKFLSQADANGRRETVGQSEFTLEDAERAGLLKGDSNWQKWPKNMLYAGAIRNGVRWFCPEITSGMTAYTPDELGAPIDADGEPLAEEEKPRETRKAAAQGVAHRKLGEALLAEIAEKERSHVLDWLADTQRCEGPTECAAWLGASGQSKDEVLLATSLWLQQASDEPPPLTPKEFGKDWAMVKTYLDSEGYVLEEWDPAGKQELIEAAAEHSQPDKAS